MADTGEATVYEIPAMPLAPSATEARAGASEGPLSPALLWRNVLWFCRLRWLVIAFLLTAGLLASVPRFQRLGFLPNAFWPFALALVLAMANVVFLGHARLLMARPTGPGVPVSLWSQIVLDLVVLSGVVHCAGAHETYICFAYLFHIVLACIFFSRAQSLMVTLLACLLFTICTAVEWAGVVPPASIYAEPLVAVAPDQAYLRLGVDLFTAQAIWLIVWYLASYLSAMVRARDRELAASNAQLIETQRRKAKSMLRMTHELKAPFAAIHANAQLLLGGHCGELSDHALDVAGRISARSRRLAGEIQDILQLANISSPDRGPLPRTSLDLPELLGWCVGQVAAMAEERGVDVSFDQPDTAVPVTGVEDHLKMLFANLPNI